MTVVSAFPDAESALLYALVPAFPDIRFVTVMPAGDPVGITVRIHRISGANRDIYVDRPVIDVDVYGFKYDAGNVSAAARGIQSTILSFAGKIIMNGVIQHANTLSGPRSLPEANPELVRYSATYELQIRS